MTWNLTGGKYRLVRVVWVDSFMLEAGWHWIDDLSDRKVSTCASTGWIISEDDNQVCLAQTIGQVGDVIQVSGVVTIPIRSVIRMEELAMDATKCPACEIQIADQGLDFTTLPGPVPRALTGELVARMAGADDPRDCVVIGTRTASSSPGPG